MRVETLNMQIPVLNLTLNLKGIRLKVYMVHMVQSRLCWTKKWKRHHKGKFDSSLHFMDYGENCLVPQILIIQSYMYIHLGSLSEYLNEITKCTL